jgi:hypothetical protein
VAGDQSRAQKERSTARGMRAALIQEAEARLGTSPRSKMPSPRAPVSALAQGQATAGANTSLKQETSDAGKANGGPRSRRSLGRARMSGTT